VAAALLALNRLIVPASAQHSAVATRRRRRRLRVNGAGNGVDDSAIRVCPGKAGLVVVVSEEICAKPFRLAQPRRCGQGTAPGSGWPVQLDHHDVEWRALDGNPLRSFSAGTSPTTAMRTGRAADRQAMLR